MASSSAPQVRRWCFTINNYNADFNFKEHLTLPLWKIKRAVWGFEVGSRTGTKHVQGYLELVRSSRLGSVRRILPQAHWEPARASSLINYKYCTKSGHFATIGDFTSEMRGYLSSEIKPPASVALIIRGLLDREVAPQVKISEEYLDKASAYERASHNMQVLQFRHKLFNEWHSKLLYPWQYKLTQELFTQNTRQIIWVVDIAGNHGKSFLSTYLDIVYGFLILDGLISPRDLGFMLKHDIRGFCFDVSRSESSSFHYGVLEAVKNGYLISGKYTGIIHRFDPRPVVVLANCRPDMTQLTRDRWNIVTLGEGEYKNLEKLPVYNPGEDFPFVKPPPVPILDEDFNLREFLLERFYPDQHETNMRAQSNSTQSSSNTLLESQIILPETATPLSQARRPTASLPETATPLLQARRSTAAPTCPLHPDLSQYLGCIYSF